MASGLGRQGSPPPLDANVLVSHSQTVPRAAPPSPFWATHQIWDRSRRIPSQTYSDPLNHIFDEIDTNGDGRASPQEISAALRSHNVHVKDEQIKYFLDCK